MVGFILELGKAIIAAITAALLMLNSLPIASAVLVEQQVVTGSDSDAYDDYGWSVAISKDGNYAAVGSPYHNNSEGAVYIYSRSGSIWTEQQKIVASDAEVGMFFGYDVDFDSTGSRIVVGAERKDDVGSDRGGVYVFSRSGSTWTEEEIIMASDAANNDFFGSSVAMDANGDFIVVGAYGKDDTFSSSPNGGKVYIFSRTGSDWSEDDTLISPNVEEDGYFGSNVDIDPDADYLIAGAYGEDSSTGRAYIYSRSGSVWSEEETLVAGDANTGDSFGTAVTIAQGANYLAVGAVNSKAVYVFNKDGVSSWSEQQKLESFENTNGFGTTIDLDRQGTNLAIGEWGFGEESPGIAKGTAHLYKRDGALWSNEGGFNGESEDYVYFGNDVQLADNASYLIIGAPGTNSSFGAAYIYADDSVPPEEGGDGVDNNLFSQVVGGTFTITGIGAYAGDIDLTTVSAPVLTATDSYFNASYVDYFTIRDNDGDSGARVRTYFSNSFWNYSGSAYEGADSSIPVTDTRLLPKINSSFAAINPTKYVTTSTTSADLQAKYTFLVNGESSSPDAESATLYSFPDVDPTEYNVLGSTTPTDAEIFRSESSAPLKGNLRIDRIEVTIPQEAAVGQYTNTLNVTLIPGS